MFKDMKVAQSNYFNNKLQTDAGQLEYLKCATYSRFTYTCDYGVHYILYLYPKTDILYPHIEQEFSPEFMAEYNQALDAGYNWIAFL